MALVEGLVLSFEVLVRVDFDACFLATGFLVASLDAEVVRAFLLSEREAGPFLFVRVAGRLGMGREARSANGT